MTTNPTNNRRLRALAMSIAKDDLIGQLLQDAKALAAFRSLVDDSGQTGPCFPWQGNLSGMGYGSFNYAGRRLPAHRVARAIADGKPIETGLFVCHHCDNPICCRPAHLFVGTNENNMQDMVAKKRNRNLVSGRDARAVLRISQQGWSIGEVAKIADLSKRVVAAIVNGVARIKRRCTNCGSPDHTRRAHDRIDFDFKQVQATRRKRGVV